MDPALGASYTSWSGMGTIFVSYASQDKGSAEHIGQWLQAQGYEVFLDLDAPPAGASDHEWVRQLKRSTNYCPAVICLVSAEWVNSSACQEELRLALHLGKRIFPVLMASAPADSIPEEIRGRAFVNLMPDRIEDGLAELGRILTDAGLRQEHFEWPPADDPSRSPYRGLEYFDEIDAGVFFGRDAVINKGLDTLRRMRAGQGERILALVGPCGIGKSSFLRAGLLARLRRDSERFVVLPVLDTTPDLKKWWASLGWERRCGLARRGQSTPGEVGRDRARPVRVFSDLGTGCRSPGAEFCSGVKAAKHSFGRCWLRIQDVLVIVSLRDDATALLDVFDREPVISVQALRIPALSLAEYDDIIIRAGTMRQPPLNVAVERTDRFIGDLDRKDALAAAGVDARATVESTRFKRTRGLCRTRSGHGRHFGGHQCGGDGRLRRGDPATLPVRPIAPRWTG